MPSRYKHGRRSAQERTKTVTEPIKIRSNVVQLLVSLYEVNEATALVELADYLRTLDGDWLLHSVTYVPSDGFGEGPLLSALVEIAGKVTDA